MEKCCTSRESTLVAVLGVAELALVVEVDAREDAFELVVLLLQLGARLVERLADARGDPLDLRPPRPLRDEEVVLVGVIGVGMVCERSASHSSSKRSESRFRKSIPKMKPL